MRYYNRSVIATRSDLSGTSEQELLDFYRVRSQLNDAVNLTDFAEEAAPDVYLVQSASKPIRYAVDLRAKTCECADFLYRGSVNGVPCKHVIACFLAKHRKPVS